MRMICGLILLVSGPLGAITASAHGKAEEAVPFLSAGEMTPEALAPALIHWSFGRPDAITVETIYPASMEGERTWNVTHRSAFLDDESGNGFDYYVIDGESLRPIRSQMFHPGRINYEIDFTETQGALTINQGGEETAYTVELPGLLLPEGPGLGVLFAGLPLAEGYEVRFRQLARWSGTPPRLGKVVTTTLHVVDKDQLEIAGVSYPTFRMEMTDGEGGFTEVWALAEAPHYWVKTNHRLDDGRFMRSEAVALSIFR